MSYHRSNMIIIARGKKGHQEDTGKKGRVALGDIGSFFGDLTTAIGGGAASLIGLGPGASQNQIEDAIQQANAQQDADVLACLNAANAQVAQLDTLINDLSKTWNPSGFYTPQQVLQINQAGMGLLKQASDAINGAKSLAESQDVTDSLNNELDAIQRREVEGSDVSSTLNMTVDVVDAPGLRRWAIGAMQAARDGMTAASVVGCLRPGWMSLMSVFVAAASTFYAILKAILGIIKKLGQIVQKLPDDIGDIITALKITAVAAVGYLLYTEWQKHKRRSA